MSVNATRALVVEGGGMRGAYAAGAVAGLFEAGERFEAVYAASSGACSAAYLAAGQTDGMEIWRRHLTGAQLIGPLKVMVGRPYLDLDYLIDGVFRNKFPLNVAALRAAAAPLWVPLTRASDGTAVYHDLRVVEDPLEYLRAAAALPLAYGKPVRLGGEDFLDGGVADPVPLLRAIEDGATDITVILTNPPGFRRRAMPPWLVRWAATPYPGAEDAIATMHHRQNQVLDTIQDPPAGIQIRPIAPPQGMAINRFTSRAKALRAATAQGFTDAMRASRHGRAPEEPQGQPSGAAGPTP
ncbi:MAG: patatin-like phospholipase family protein [Thermoplasmatota archaeon]